MIRRNRTRQKFIFITLFLGIVVLYNEYIVYEIESYHWTVKDCNECTKMLLVADPQILGELHETYFGAWFARWDNDRYLAKTFSRAVLYSKPDVIAFLGDLMDEGEIATTEQFAKYKKRFDDIFHTPEHIMKIYIPGDNDIGGEDSSVSIHMLNRFKYAFTQPNTLTYKSLIIFKVNRFTHTMPNAPQDAFLNEYIDKNTTNVVLSHLPLLFSPGAFVKNVIKELSPQIIFSAHHHKAMHISYDTTIEQASNVLVLTPHESTLYRLRMDMGDIHEVQIPTCSYRMGTFNMGYGLAYIDTADKSAEITILWLPERFPKLAVYLVCIVITLLYLIFTICCCRTSAHGAYSHLPTV